MRILIIDNYDSFTYNLSLMLKSITGKHPDIVRNDAFTLEEVQAYDKILLSPGPGVPEDAGLMPALIRQYASGKSILGVCLGHQAIASAFGARLENMTTVYHGVSTIINQVYPDSLFKGMGNFFGAGRYHSWMVSREGFPGELQVTATDDAGNIMALRHRTYDLRGVQFHPESVLTRQGKLILENWLSA
jgi:anthranilate synthase component 2